MISIVSRIQRSLGGGVFVALVLVVPAVAAEIRVASLPALQSAVNGAVAGDVIVLENGTYTNGTLTIGTSDITVKAATPGGVYLNGTQSINVSGNRITFSGFQFTSGDIGSGYVIVVSGNRNVLTQLNFTGYSAKKYIDIAAGTQYNEITYCNIENKPATAVSGCTIQISTSPTVPGYHKIRYCSFRRFPGPGGDFGNEPIRIGLGAERNNASRTTVEYCYFDSLGYGDGESVSVKCCENVIRYNTFNNNPKGMLVFRNGDRNVAYGNFFINGSGGIRCKEARDIYCYNNYFETSGSSGSMDAVTMMFDTSGGIFLSNINFLFNTFVNCGNIDLGGKGPTNITFANNLFVKSSGSIFSSPNTSTSWAGNMYSGTLGITITSGMTSVVPQLARNADGFYALTSGSPAIDASSASFPAVLDITNVNDDPAIMLDISGQSRPSSVALKDVGCDEYGSDPILNRPLALAAVGPSYLGGPVTAVAGEGAPSTPAGLPRSCKLEECFPNPFNPATTIRYELPVAGPVTLKVYDELAREVATLFEGVSSAGVHQVRWNAASVPSGVYLCRLQTVGHTAAIKLLLVK